jgi:type IV pilus assembly protein PilX
MRSTSHQQQRGASLIVVLMVLVAILISGMSASQLSLQSVQLVRNQRDRMIAFLAAEAALIDAQRDLLGARTHVFPRGHHQQTPPCHTSGDHVGLCRPAPTDTQAVWDSEAFMQGQEGVAYGQFTKKAMQVGGGMLPSQLPRYLIERLGTQALDEDPNQRHDRITSIGFGPGKSRVRLQIIVQHPHQGSPSDTPNLSILSWKEILPTD